MKRASYREAIRWIADNVGFVAFWVGIAMLIAALFQ